MSCSVQKLCNAFASMPGKLWNFIISLPESLSAIVPHLCKGRQESNTVGPHLTTRTQNRKKPSGSSLVTLRLAACQQLSKKNFQFFISSPILRIANLGYMPRDYLKFVPSGSFQRLRELEVIVDDLTVAWSLLEKIGNKDTSKLRMLNVSTINEGELPPSSDDLKEFFQYISYHKDLTVIKLCFVAFDTVECDRQMHNQVLQDPKYKITSNTVYPLFTSMDVRKVDILYRMNDAIGVDYSIRAENIPDLKGKFVKTGGPLDKQENIPDSKGKSIKTGGPLDTQENIPEPEGKLVHFTKTGRILDMHVEMDSFVWNVPLLTGKECE